MEKPVITQNSSRPVSLILLIPALLLNLISLALGIVGFGLIPIIPALLGIVLCICSYSFFKKSFRTFTIIIVSISLVSIMVSVFQGSIIKKKVANDSAFDSTMVRTQQGIDIDLNEAFSEDTTGPGIKSDTIVRSSGEAKK